LNKNDSLKAQYRRGR